MKKVVSQPQSEFTKAVYQLVKSIPRGRVMTYGQVAVLLGHPRAAQQVGWVLHWADYDKVPYQRVVNRFGSLADGYTRGGREAHRVDLETEGIEVRDDMTIDLNKYLWNPPKEMIPKMKRQKQLDELEFAGIVVRPRSR
jgi:methylated-DNA-protein-cysteine methyltransferase related protein